MLSSQSQDSFFNLIRLGIGHSAARFPEQNDWPAIAGLANKHGLLGVMIDGIEHLSEQQRPPEALLLEWIGNTLQNYEQRYSLYEKAISKLAGFYNQHGYRMMLLKGYACSLDWPNPEHRPCGDIDIWLFGQWKEADKELGSWFKVHGSNARIDTSHHHHTVFDWMGFVVENHYDFVNVYAHKSSRELEKVFKELGKDDSYYAIVDGERVYLPSPNLHALFLIRHMVSHFASAELPLRQVLDWVFFVEKHTKEIDWEWLDEKLTEYHMKDFLNCINGICVEDLGFPSIIFPFGIQYNPILKDRALSDILAPEYMAAEPRGLVKRLIYKYRRWQGNAWKQELCYAESRWSAFWYGAWAKMLKPTSI